MIKNQILVGLILTLFLTACIKIVNEPSNNEKNISSLNVTNVTNTTLHPIPANYSEIMKQEQENIRAQQEKILEERMKRNNSTYAAKPINYTVGNFS